MTKPREYAVESTVETLSPTRVRLAIEVPFAELEPSLKRAYKEIGAQVNIPAAKVGAQRRHRPADWTGDNPTEAVKAPFRTSSGGPGRQR
jgi:hypothetical protein